MKKITIFYLTNCPYCHNAKKALEELIKETPEYNEIPVEWIEESRQPQLAEQYDYYYVPTVFVGNHKLYEADPSENYRDCKKNMKAALDTVLEM